MALCSKALASSLCEWNPVSQSSYIDSYNERSIWIPRHGKNASQTWCEGTLGWFFADNYFSVHRRLTTYFMGYFAAYYFGHVRNLRVVPQSTIKFYYLRWVAIIFSIMAILLIPKYWRTHELGVASVLYTTDWRAKYLN